MEMPGTRIGPYKLLEQIGEGGMGVVYVASQREPIRRKVALKIIKPGMDTRERGDSLRGRAASPGPDGSPEHCQSAGRWGDRRGTTLFRDGAGKGGSHHRLLRSTPTLESRERLELFVELCHGVQHAHQKGVIHRDLKPRNVLIDTHDCRPVPKIIDFGIAKAMGWHLTEQSLHTGLDQLVGTPQYMSPEQAGLNNVDVDTRSDIYALGVMLYELLTGHTPVERDTLRTVRCGRTAADHSGSRSAASQRAGQYPRGGRPVHDFRAPSRGAPQTQPATSRRTGLDRHEGAGQGPGTALRDGQRLSGRRGTLSSRRAGRGLSPLGRISLQEVCSPPPGRFGHECLGRLGLNRGHGVSTWQAMRATHAEWAAITERNEKEQQALRTTNAEQRTAKALLKAEDRLTMARQAVDEMYTQVAEKWLAQQAEMTPLQTQFLEKALAFYQRFAAEDAEDSDDSAVRFEAAKAQQRVGEIQHKLGQYTEAEAASRRAIELFEQLSRETRDPAPCNQALAGTHVGLATILKRVGQIEEAVREASLALGLRRALVSQFPSDTQFQIDLAETLAEMGSQLNTNGRSREAEDNYREGVAILESLLTRSPADRDLKYKLTRSQFFMARTIPPQIRPKEVETLDRLVVDNAGALVADDPNNPEYRVLLANCHNALGIDLIGLRRWPESEANHRQALAIHQRLTEEFPQLLLYRASFAQTLHLLANVFDKAGKFEEAEQTLRQVREIREKLAAEHPEVPDFRNSIAGTLNNLATTLMNRGEWEEARKLLEQAIVHERAALETNPNNKYYRQYLTTQLNNLTGVQLALGDPRCRQPDGRRFGTRLLQVQNPERLFPTVVVEIEGLINHMEKIRRSPGGPRQEPLLAGKLLCIKAVIRQAIERRPGRSKAVSTRRPTVHGDRRTARP